MRIARATLTALLALLLLHAGCSRRRAGQNGNADNGAQPNASPAPDADARSLFERGVGEYRHDRDDEAAADLQKAVELDPDFPEAHYRLGLALHATGQKDEADKAFADPAKAYQTLPTQTRKKP